jgi:hypothetical protein
LANGRVDWYGEDVILTVDDTTGQVLARIALQVEGQAKVNIQANGQIDTGFMLNSGYTVTDDESTYAEALAKASSRNPEGEMVQQVALPEGVGAAVAFGAEYAVFQELIESFLYRALEQVGPNVEGIIATVAREEGLRD